MADTTIAAAATDSGVKAWKKTLYEKPNQGKANATDIGWLRNNDSRLNVVSELTSSDKQQVFKIKALTDGKMALGMQSDKGVRIQIHDNHNRLIADSEANMGKASENFDAMKRSAYDMKTGTYYVTVTRAKGVPATDPVHYALQLQQGSKYKNDYVTTQVALSQAQRAQLATNPQANMPAGLQTYTSAGTLLGDAMSSRSSMFGGVDYSTGGNILGVKTNA